MNTTELIRPPATVGEMVAEVIPLIGVVAGYGPAVILFAGPWLLLALMLSAPFAVLLTLVTVMLAAATVLVALTAAVLAAPYLLVRRLRSYRARHAVGDERAAHLVPLGSTRVVA